MEKILKKYTMIPQHLYVKRNADEQLISIVDEMQRPGYVLVARQMGKTNLLFNAKRTLENTKRLFVYVDLSNTFDLERDCYRSIIDTVIEPNEEIFSSIEEEIYKVREKSLPPHNEYSKSLRIILKEFKGVIVIILDEIDALRSAEYSDNIFAQIRSNYFSRTNFQEFERLTYILSGVIEPTELIKDRNKSPFNIGEKIYLDDFTQDEHDCFINKSKLSINRDISAAIYGWTNGNPRLTFDICSDLESLLIDKEQVTTKVLDKLIQKKYLTTFDTSPVDHIRELVKSNKRVRKAVLQIQKGNTEKLSDDIKKKLYLYGIINSKFDEKTQIKNKIINLSLTEGWVASVDKETEGNFSYALEQFDLKEYQNTIDALIEFINNSKPSEKQLELSNYHLGFSYYYLQKYGKASEYFNKKYENEPYVRNSKTLLGICKISEGMKDAGSAILEEVVLTETNDFAYHNALMNLAKSSEDYDKKYSLYQKLYDSTYKAEGIDEEELNPLRTIALYYQAEVLLHDNDIEETLEKLRLALKYSSKSNSLYLKYLLLHFDKNADKQQLKTDIVELIVANMITFDSLNIHAMNFCENHLYRYLGLVFDNGESPLFEKLLNYSVKYIFNNVNKHSIAFEASKASDAGENILEYILSNYNDIDKELLLSIYRDLSLKIEKSDSGEDYFTKYKEIFSELEIIEKDDIYLFSSVLKRSLEDKTLFDSLDVCLLFESKLKYITGAELKLDSLVVYYWSAYVYLSLGKSDDAKLYAEKTIQLIETSNNETTSFIDKEGLKSVVKQMKSIINPPSKNKTIRNTVKIGRNEKVTVEYNDGRIVKNKYKKFISDIKSKKCRVISSAK